VYCELYPHHTPAEVVLAVKPKGFILSGGPASVYDEGAPRIPTYVLESGLPILGICYGMQALTHALGGTVAPAPEREYGPAEIEHLSESLLLPDHIRAVWMSHGDRIDAAPPGFTILARSANSPIAAIAADAKPYFGLQFHPEVQHTPGGADILRAFAVEVCGARSEWRPDSIIETGLANIRNKVRDETVIAGVSGGVDSTVAAALVQRAVGDQLHCIFVDNGLLREGEPDQVIRTVQKEIGAQVHVARASETFLEALAGVRDPEVKRRIIGEKFIRTFEAQAQSLGSVRFLVQGTIYPDVVERPRSSGSGPDKDASQRRRAA
jgi:GMP synthase (glutamine-hydrolysing)